MSKRIRTDHFVCAVLGGIMIAGAASCASRDQASVRVQDTPETRDAPESRDIKLPVYLPPEHNDVELDVIDIELHNVQSPDGPIRYYTFKYNPDNPSDPCLNRITGTVGNLVERKVTNRFCGDPPDEKVIEHVRVREGSVSRNNESR